MKLYEINKAIEECLIDIVDLETGECVGGQVDLEKLNNLQMAKDEKIESICLFYKNILSDAEALKKEKECFAKRENSARKKAESLKGYIDFVQRGEEFDGKKCNVTYRKSTVVEIQENAKLPNEYLTIKMSPNKAEIKKAIKNGEKINGCSIVEKNNISVK